MTKNIKKEFKGIKILLEESLANFIILIIVLKFTHDSTNLNEPKVFSNITKLLMKL